MRSKTASRRASSGGSSGTASIIRAVFDSLYARELEELGFVIDRQGGKKWEVAGITQPMIDTFSKRRTRSRMQPGRLGITDPALKAELGAKTRSKKQKALTMQELREAWDAQLTDDERDALARVYPGNVRQAAR